jgi:hypothetical protein
METPGKMMLSTTLEYIQRFRLVIGNIQALLR